MMYGACLECGKIFIVKIDKWFYCSDKCLQTSKKRKKPPKDYIPK